RRDRAISRCRHDRDQSRVVRQRGERDARSPVPAHLARSRHCVGHCRPRSGGPVEFHSRRTRVRADRARARRALTFPAPVAAHILSATMAPAHADPHSHEHGHSHGPGHAHGHDHGASQAGRLRISLAITLVVLVAELVGGFVANSLTLFVTWFSRRPATPKRTYGYLRLEIFAAFLNGGALLVISALIIWEAVTRIRQPEPVAGGLMLVIALVGLVANVIAARTLHPASESSLNLRGAYLHILGDLLGSVGTVAAAVVIRTTGWHVADPIASIIVSLLILRSAWALVRESVD